MKAISTIWALVRTVYLLGGGIYCSYAFTVGKPLDRAAWVGASFGFLALALHYSNLARSEREQS